MKTIKRWLIILSVAIFSVDCYSQPLWVVSGAAIGDTSVYLYPVGGWSASTSLMLAHANNEDSLRVYGTTGAPAGIQIYRVDKLPNAICASPTITSTRYFGVFVVNGTSPTYNVSYHYGGNPTVTPIIEPDLELAERLTNADTACTAWTAMAAVLDMVGDSLYKGVLSGRKEIILTTKTNPLPIELLSFNVKCSNDGGVDLFWSSASEINNDYYTIERSDDAVNFEPIATIQGAGNSNSVQYYMFTDVSAPTGVVLYYRLKQTDFDGNSEYFNIEVVECNGGNLSSQVLVYDNITSDYFYVMSQQRQIIRMAVYNAIGQVVLTKTMNAFSEGWKEKIDVSFLKKGVYLITLTINDEMVVDKLIIR